MDSTAETPVRPPALAPERPLLVRVSILGVVLAGALALGLAAVMSDYPMGGPPLFAMLAAVAGGVTWHYSPRVGYWVLVVDGLVVVIGAGVALAAGALPWTLVAFWGGAAILLAAVLHLIADSSPGRSTNVTLVAVISLLFLSGIGLSLYVQTTWSTSERAMLTRIPPLTAAAAQARATWLEPVTPAEGGSWECMWLLPMKPAEALACVRSALARDGWRVVVLSAGKVIAEKHGERLSILLAPMGGTSPGATTASTQLTATLGTAPAAAFP